MRRFSGFLLIIILICGVFVLVTNGLYYWYSQPALAVQRECSALLDAGLPDTTVDEAGRLAFYQDCADKLGGLPDLIDSLNRQPWAFAVLIREDLAESAPALLERARRGQAAVEAYFAIVKNIRAQAEIFQASAGTPAGESFSARLDWYAGRIAAVSQLEKLYADSLQIPDLALAGQVFSRSDLGVESAAAEISSIRQPVADLQILLAQSAELEKQIDEIYVQEPGVDDHGRVRAATGVIIAELDKMAAAGAALRQALPQPLQPDLDSWLAGMTERSAFVKALQTWWRDSVLMLQSIASAETDRATARRYIEDSLTEENVETAYLWTQTAEQYKMSMATAIDFANIYIARANEQAGLLNSSRPAYRIALGMEAAVRMIGLTDPIDPDAFWLAS